MLMLQDIRRLRKQHDISQTALAKEAGVSQSLIAKIETNRAEPSYSNAMSIFSALENLRESAQGTAKEYMKKNVTITSKGNPLMSLVSLMKRRGISQIPVEDNGKIIGMVTEKEIFSALESGMKISSLLVEEVMGDAPPLISKNTSYTQVVGLLHDHQIVLVTDVGNIVGVITKSDIFSKA